VVERLKEEQIVVLIGFNAFINEEQLIKRLYADPRVQESYVPNTTEAVLFEIMKSLTTTNPNQLLASLVTQSPDLILENGKKELNGRGGVVRIVTSSFLQLKGYRSFTDVNQFKNCSEPCVLQLFGLIEQFGKNSLTAAFDYLQNVPVVALGLDCSEWSIDTLLHKELSARTFSKGLWYIQSKHSTPLPFPQRTLFSNAKNLYRILNTDIAAALNRLQAVAPKKPLETTSEISVSQTAMGTKSHQADHFEEKTDAQDPNALANSQHSQGNLLLGLSTIQLNMMQRCHESAVSSYHSF
jgi:hypothetical protein